mmetsp:Transcript_27513/g.93939  ORF Transcript_27513/g.93939 Transcript_27513/m.93939 type:complete len:325 (-) Transcript_27513:472-1446(-)
MRGVLSGPRAGDEVSVINRWPFATTTSLSTSCPASTSGVPGCSFSTRNSFTAWRATYGSESVTTRSPRCESRSVSRSCSSVFFTAPSSGRSASAGWCAGGARPGEEAAMLPSRTIPPRTTTDRLRRARSAFSTSRTFSLPSCSCVAESLTWKRSTKLVVLGPRVRTLARRKHTPHVTRAEDTSSSRPGRSGCSRRTTVSSLCTSLVMLIMWVPSMEGRGGLSPPSTGLGDAPSLADEYASTDPGRWLLPASSGSASAIRLFVDLAVVRAPAVGIFLSPAAPLLPSSPPARPNLLPRLDDDAAAAAVRRRPRLMTSCSAEVTRLA